MLEHSFADFLSNILSRIFFWLCFLGFSFAPKAMQTLIPLSIFFQRRFLLKNSSCIYFFAKFLTECSGRIVLQIFSAGSFRRFLLKYSSWILFRIFFSGFSFKYSFTAFTFEYSFADFLQKTIIYSSFVVLIY